MSEGRRKGGREGRTDGVGECGEKRANEGWVFVEQFYIHLYPHTYH